MFAKNYKSDLPRKRKNNHEVNVIIDKSNNLEPGKCYDDGITILEALAATGLRSIRYAQEIPGVKQIIANDISEKAVLDMKTNITDNNVEHLITASHEDATYVLCIK